jgi:DNA repair exonuclease SbcCD ATPase subunit
LHILSRATHPHSNSLDGDDENAHISTATVVDLFDDEEVVSMRSSSFSGGVNQDEALILEVSQLETTLAELSLENSIQREKLDTLNKSIRNGESGASELADSERTCVKLAKELSVQVKEVEVLKEKYDEITKKLAATDEAALKNMEERRSALEAQVASLKEEKKMLKAVAKQYKLEAMTRAHELEMIRNNQHHASAPDGAPEQAPEEK